MSRHTTIQNTYVRERLSSGLLELSLILLLELLIELELRRLKGRGLDEVQAVVACQLPSQPEEGLFEVVVRLGRNVVVLQILLPVESNLFRLDLPVLDLDLVSTEDDRNVLTDTSQVTVPIGNILVGNTGGDIKHDDCTLALDVIAITEATEFLFAISK